MRIEEALALLDARRAEILRLINEVKNAKEALESVEETKELLVPLGGGVFVKATWEGTVLRDVGGGIVIETTPEKVKERLEKAIEKLEDELRKIEEERKKIIEQVRRR